jgi:hypothetical protein
MASELADPVNEAVRSDGHWSLVIRRWLPTDSWVRALVAPAFLFIACSIDRNYQTDLWHHAARGRVLATEGHLLNADRFTYTVPGLPLQDTNWLSQIAFYQLHQLGGLELLQGVNALVIAITLGLVVWLCRWKSGSLLVAAGVGLFVFLGMWQIVLLIRPQTFSLLLFVLLYATLEGSDRRPWLLVVPPLLLGLWVNVHGGFPVGLALVGCYLLAAFVEGAWQQQWDVLRNRKVWLLGACLGACVLATLANPYGWRVYQYVGLTSGRAAARKIDEWLPPGLDVLTGKLWAVSILGVLVLFALPGRRPTVREVCLSCVFLAPSFGSVRMVAWWLLAVAPVAARLVAVRVNPDSTLSPLTRAPTNPESSSSSCPPSPKRRGGTKSGVEDMQPSVGAAVTCGALLVGLILSLPCLERWSPIFRYARSPHRTEYDLQKATDRLETLGPGRVFTRFEWSEYLVWSLGPQFPIFMDGRIEIYPDSVWAEYLAVTSGQAGWQAILDKYKVEYLLIDTGPYHAGLRPLVEQSRTWQKVDAYGEVHLYRRVHPASQKQ